MEDQLIGVLRSTQSSDNEPRQQAEADLQIASSNAAFPVSLANIASHTSVEAAVRLVALTTLRQFVEKYWAPEEDLEGPVVLISPEARQHVRRAVLELTLSPEDERKAKRSASSIVGRIASTDFPDEWPDLLPVILTAFNGGTDSQVHGALIALSDILQEAMSDEQFYGAAQDIVKVITEVAMDEGRKPSLRAFAISVYRACYEYMDIVRDNRPEVKLFAESSMQLWMPFFEQVIKSRLPQQGITAGSQPDSWNYVIAMKLQVVKTLLKIRQVFPDLLLPRSVGLLTICWEELSSLQPLHQELYLDNEAQGRLEDADFLPYTLDFLILEELDFLNQCFRARPVQVELESQLKAHPSAHETPWMMDMMKMLVSYSRVTQEEEGLWDIDCSLYLAEETSVSANYTSRTAAGDLMIKLGEWYDHRLLDALFVHTKSVFSGDATLWRDHEASLFLYNMLLGDFEDRGVSKKMSPEITASYLELVDFAISRAEKPLLKARGFLTGGAMAKFSDTPAPLLDRVIQAIGQSADGEEVVQVACIKAVDGFIVGGKVGPEHQVPILSAIGSYMDTKDPSDMQDADELLCTIAETLRSVIKLDTRIVISADVRSVDLLFVVAKLGASNFQATMMVCEAFEEIVSTLNEPNPYALLCTKVLPTLTSAFDVANVTEDDPLITVAAELLQILVQHGPEPLPPGFVAATFPKLNRLLMESKEGEVLRPGAEAVKFILMHDHHQVFGWHDANGMSGLEFCLRIIDRLLGPSVEDNAASEVGGLAAELVEKAGQERLGPFLLQLLQAVANRLATAEAASFIQSLILVFARLSLNGAQDVVEFLSQIVIGGEPGLKVVMSKWLENSVMFAGYDEIRQNVIALSKLYALNDSRLNNTNVKGDLIMTNDTRILTRSRSRQNPDQYTIIPAPLKILKVLVEDLVSFSGPNAAATASAAAAAAAAELEEEGSDDGWEDDPDVLDLSLGTTKADIMSYLEPRRAKDDQTQQYLIDFFLRAAREDTAGFKAWYVNFTDEEKAKLNEVANETSVLQ